VTVDVDGELLAAVRAVAGRSGVPLEDLFERALRGVLAGDFDQLAAELVADQRRRGVSVSDNEGFVFAYEELRAVRTQRRNAP
jgi:hypothetical protein